MIIHWFTVCVCVCVCVCGDLQNRLSPPEGNTGSRTVVLRHEQKH